MVITYSGKSAPSAQKIAAEEEDIELVRGSEGDINWGRNKASTLLNPNISNSTNKRVMRELFKEHGVPMPYLYDWSEQNGVEMIFPVVGRPDHHSKGRGFWLVKNEEDLRKALRGTRRKAAATHFMEYIAADREYRVHIFNGKSIRISQKKFDDEGNYTTAKPSNRVGRVRKAAKQAVEALGLDFGAVDVLARGDNNEEVFVLEVNAAPGIGGSLPKLYAEIFRKWYEEGEQE